MTRFIPLQWLLLEQWRRNHLAATFSAALIGAGFMLVMPFLPIYTSAQLGVESKAAVAIWSGLILGISPLITSFVGPLWGKLADRYGLRIMAIRVSLVLFVIWFLMGLARNVQELLFLRILSGFFGGFGSVSVALVAHSAPKDRITSGDRRSASNPNLQHGPGSIPGRSAGSLDRYSKHLLRHGGNVLPHPGVVSPSIPGPTPYRDSSRAAPEDDNPSPREGCILPVATAQSEDPGYPAARGHRRSNAALPRPSRSS